MTSELKPCPFCGGTDLKSGGDDKVVGVYCMTCQAQSPNHYGSYEWNTRAVPDVPELVRYSVPDRYDKVMQDGEYVLHSQAAAMLAAKDARIKELHDAGHDSFKTAMGWQQRAEAAEAKLVQIKAQEPVMWLCVYNDRWSDRAIITSYPSRRDILKADGYEISPLYFSPLAPKGRRTI